MSDRSTVLLEHHLKELKLPTFLREYGKVAGQCAAEGVDHPGYLLRLSELEIIDRHHRSVGSGQSNLELRRVLVYPLNDSSCILYTLFGLVMDFNIERVYLFWSTHRIPGRVGRDRGYQVPL